MAFDEQGFRKAAASAGYTADEIESHVAKEKQTAEPTLPKANTYEDFANKEMPAQPSAAKRLEQKATEVSPSIPYLGAAGVGALGAAAAIGAGKKIYNSLTDEMAADVEAKKVEAKRIEPEFNVSNRPVPGEPAFDLPSYTQPPAPPTAPAPQPKPTVEELKQKLGVAPPVVPQAPTAPVAQPPAPPIPQAPVPQPPALPVQQTPVQQAPVQQAPIQQPVAQAPAAPVEPIKAAIPPPVQEIKTGTNKPAFVGQGPENPKKFKTKYDSVSDVPKGYAFVPGANTIDVARNNLGQETYTQEFSKRDFPATNKESEAISTEINRKLGRPTNQELLDIGIKPPTGTPGITKLIAGKKIVQVGGVFGALVALPDLAKAAEAGDRNALGEMAMGAIPGAGPQAGLYHSALNANEQNQLNYLRRMQAAKERGPGNRGQAYDPRKFYSPMAGSLDVPGIAPYR
jgi:hypothetical protein